jgi:nucleoside-diphosphate-sugar epimerase
MPTCLITGATGFVGGHLAEACAGRGYTVRALARAGSDTVSLENQGATLVRGDMTDPATVREAVEGADVVFHCAARVGDWGPVEEYRAVNVEGLRHLLEAVKGRPLRRFVHFSTLGVYAARHHYATDESEPLPERQLDGYTQSKAEAEQLALSYHKEHGVPVVVLRPGFVYGPHDRTVLPKLLQALHEGRVRYIAGGKYAMNTIYVGNLVEAALLAAEKDGAVGQVYNLTDGDVVSKKRFIDTVADGLGAPRPRRSVPLWLARFVAWVVEGHARRRNRPTAPPLTQARLKFLGLNLDFSIEKARRELGYAPRWGFDAGMAETLAWYRSQVGVSGPPAAVGTA